MKILILGGTGYLGKKIVERFLDEGYEVVCIYRNESRLGNLHIDSNQLRYVHIDNLEELLTQENSGIDWFVNTACKYLKYGVDDQEVWDANLFTPMECFLLCMDSGIKQFLTIDTGLPGELNIYSKSKKIFAEIGNYYTTNNEKFKFYNILLENFYGEDEPEGRFLPDVIKKLRHNEDILLTEGTQHRDFVYISDVVKNIVRLLSDCPYEGYRDIPLGSGEAPAIREVVEYLKRHTDSRSNLLFGAISKRRNEPDTMADKKKMREAGIVIEYPWKKGMLKMLNERL